MEKDDYNQIFQPEFDLNKELAFEVNIIIQKFLPDKTNIHLLGKCAGGGIAIKMFAEYANIYQALYLGVPASPNNVEEVDFNNRKIIIAWDARDAYPFTWGKSNQECSSYEKTLASKNVHNAILCTFNENKEEHVSNFHEIPDQLFDLIRENY